MKVSERRHAAKGVGRVNDDRQRSEHDEQRHDVSAVARLLRQHGVGGPIPVREAARRTGVSRTTINNWLDSDPANPIRHNKTSLTRIATGLGIDRTELANASLIDNGAHGIPIGDGDADAILARLVDLQRQARAIEQSVTQLMVLYAQRFADGER